MTAEFEITKDDWSAFNLYHHAHSPTARRSYRRAWIFPAAILLVVAIVGWALANNERDAPWRNLVDLLPVFCGAPLYLIVYPWLYRRQVRKIIAGMVGEGQNRGFFCRHRVAISPEGIADVSELSQGSTAWRAVERVVRNADYAFIYVSSLSAVIIPRRAFATSKEFEEFVSMTRNYHEKSMAYPKTKTGEQP